MIDDRDRYPAFDPTAVGIRVEQVRVAFGLDKGTFADSVDIDRSSYSKIITGAKTLKADMAYRISERWGVPMDFLYKGRLVDLPENLNKFLRTS